MVENRKKHQQNCHPIIHCPRSECSRGRERSEQSGASKRVSGASERANGRASGPVLTSWFLFVPDHSAPVPSPAPLSPYQRRKPWHGDWLLTSLYFFSQKTFYDVLSEKESIQEKTSDVSSILGQQNSVHHWVEMAETQNSYVFF